MMHLASSQSGLNCVSNIAAEIAAMQQNLIYNTSNLTDSDVALIWNKCSTASIARTIESKKLAISRF
jgi:hypothetical protein